MSLWAPASEIEPRKALWEGIVTQWGEVHQLRACSLQQRQIPATQQQQLARRQHLPVHVHMQQHWSISRAHASPAMYDN